MEIANCKLNGHFLHRFRRGMTAYRIAMINLQCEPWVRLMHTVRMEWNARWLTRTEHTLSRSIIIRWNWTKAAEWMCSSAAKCGTNANLIPYHRWWPIDDVDNENIMFETLMPNYYQLLLCWLQLFVARSPYCSFLISVSLCFECIEKKRKKSCSFIYSV